MVGKANTMDESVFDYEADEDLVAFKAVKKYGEEVQADEIELSEPVKIRWTGYARGRITEYNSHFGIDDGWRTASHGYRPDRFLRAADRLKTVLDIRTVEEADAIFYELQNYHSSSRTWMNGSMDRSIARVKRLLREEMEEMGYIPQFKHTDGGYKRFIGFEK